MHLESNEDNYRYSLKMKEEEICVPLKLSYPETRSLGMSGAKTSAMSLDPMLAMHCRARLTCTGFLEVRSFLMLWLIRLIRSLFWLISTEINR